MFLKSTFAVDSTAATLSIAVLRNYMQDVRYHLHTLLLFTWTDYKTIFFPVLASSCAATPALTFSGLLHGAVWIWIHLLLCNVSNQSKGAAEDALNRPWRPIPSRRLTESQATAFRWMLVISCLLWSSFYGWNLVLVTASLVVTTILYDEGGLAGHPVGKNFCNVGGYVSFELGAGKVMAGTNDLDNTALYATILSGLVIFTTIQAQDFPDVAGDLALGRVTLPIYAPSFSRHLTFLIIPVWSGLISEFWSIGETCSILFILLGFYVGCRYYFWRTPDCDKKSYLIFNVWLMTLHLLPIHARTGLLVL